MLIQSFICIFCYQTCTLFKAVIKHCIIQSSPTIDPFLSLKFQSAVCFCFVEPVSISVFSLSRYHLIVSGSICISLCYVSFYWYHFVMSASIGIILLCQPLLISFCYAILYWFHFVMSASNGIILLCQPLLVSFCYVSF